MHRLPPCSVLISEAIVVVYRAAQLIGDFNNWDGSKHIMERDEFGVWSIRLPDEGGVSAIPHGSKVKFRMQKGDGTWVDRIPAWIKFAVVDPTVFAAYYDGVYWDPPVSQRYILALNTTYLFSKLISCEEYDS